MQGKPNPNGPLVLGSMRDAVAEKIRWNPETGSSIHGTLEELNKRFEEVVVRLPKVSKKEGAKPHVWVRRATSKRGGSQKNKLKRKWEEELGGLKKRIWEGGSALRRDLKRKTGPGNVVEGRSKRMRAAYGKPLGSSQGGLVGQGGQTANEHKEGGGASQHKGTVAHRKEGLESTQGKQHAAKGPSAKAEGLRHEKDFMGTAPEVPGVPQERRRLEGNGGGKHVNEEKEPSKVGSLIQGVEQRKEADGKACQGAQCGGGQGQIGVQTFEVEGKDDGVGDTQGGGNEGSNQGSREHLNAGQTNQAEVGSGKKACNEEAGNAAGGGEQDKAKPAVLVKGPGLRLRISLKDLPGPVTKVPRQPESVAPREAVHTAEGQEKTAEQLREGAVGAKASPKEQKDEAVESRERLPGTAAERGGRAFGERGNRSPVENVEAAVEGQSEVKRGLANGGSEAAEGGKDRETAARRSQALETSRTDVGSALEESEPNKTSNPQAPDCLVEERTSSRKLNNGGAHLTEPREDAEAVRKLVREAARTKLSELQLVTGRYREIERALLELLKAPDCRPEFKVELKLALRRMRDGELPTPPRWDRPEDDASEKECPTGFEEMRAERSRSGGESSLRIGDVIAGGGRDVIAGVTLLGPSEKLRAWREARARKMTSSRVAPIFVPSRGRADLAYLNFEGKCALGPERVGETPVVVFVRGEELEAYRARWPELLFAILPRWADRSGSRLILE